MNEQKESKSLGRLIANLESDPDIQAAIQVERAAQGLAIDNPSIEPLKQRVFQTVQDAMACYEETHATQPSHAASPSIAEHFGEAVGQIAVGIKQLLGGFRRESFVAVHLGDEAVAAEPDVVRVIPLADCPGLRQRLPWLGGALRVYQQERRPDQTTAKFTAFAETLDVGPNEQGGELRVVLSASDGKRSEVLLSFDFPSSEFPLRLSADESQLTLECYADSAA